MGITRAQAMKLLPQGVSMDPYFPDEAQCSEEHVRHMFRGPVPALATCSKYIVAQGSIKTYAVIGAYAVGDRKPDRLGAGHVLFLDDIGKGKTLLAEIIAKVLGGRFERFQGTPDKMPADFTGYYIIDVDENGKRYSKLHEGPAFGQIILIDELNRATARAQSSILQVAAEGSATFGGKTHNVGTPFIMGTANPQEHEGTTPPSEALLDRFIFEVRGDDFTAQDYIDILNVTEKFGSIDIRPVCNYEQVCETRMFFHQTIEISDEIKDRIGAFLEAAYNPHAFGYLEDLARQFGDHVILSGISGRGDIHLAGAAKTLAAFRYRNYVTPEDVRKVLPHVLRHRIIFNHAALNSFRSEWRHKTTLDTSDRIIKQLIKEAW